MTSGTKLQNDEFFYKIKKEVDFIILHEEEFVAEFLNEPATLGDVVFGRFTVHYTAIQNNQTIYGAVDAFLYKTWKESLSH